MKIISVVGGRPNFIKLWAVCKHFDKKVRHIILHTGQHYDYRLSQSFFKEFGLPPPQYNLNVGSASHARQTAKIAIGCEEYFLNERPSIVIVYGDMNSTLGAALAASKLNIPLAHVEAGIRSFDTSIPEEINRTIVDHVSQLLFAPTKIGLHNLVEEGLKAKACFPGDTTYDSFLKVEKKLSADYYKKLKLKEREYFWATIHRPSNTDNFHNLRLILTRISALGEHIVLSLHPRTKKMIRYFGLTNLIRNKNIIVKEPVKYIESLSMQKFAKGILTDSGGIQKEAYYLRVPCITFRNTTEWPELVELGANHLWFSQKKPLKKIIDNFKIPKSYPNFFGNGQAGKLIAESIIEFYGRHR